MYSNFVSFEEIIELVKDDTGIENLRNLYPKIRRFIYRAEKDIGFGGSTLLKRVTYSLEQGNLLFDGKQYKLRLPEDCMYLEEVGMCKEGICPGEYKIQGKWMFFCESRKLEKFSLIYYTLLKDGEGNPVTTENHSEAVVAGIVYWLYKARRFKDKGQFNQMRYYEEYYHDRISEARGDDATPNTEREWQKLSQLMNMNSKEVLLYIEDENCFCALPESEAPVYNAETGTLMESSASKLTTSTGTVSGHTTGVGTGASDSDGSYPDPDEPTEPDTPVEPEPEENLPPTIDDIEITVDTGVTTVISLETIEGYAGSPYSDPENDQLDAIRIDSIYPYNTGVFFYNGVPVSVNLVITRQDLIDEKLTHVGGDNKENKTDYISFSVRDGVNGNWIS
jgi:hypothetical protein